MDYRNLIYRLIVCMLSGYPAVLFSQQYSLRDLKGNAQIWDEGKIRWKKVDRKTELLNSTLIYLSKGTQVTIRKTQRDGDFRDIKLHNAGAYRINDELFRDIEKATLSFDKLASLDGRSEHAVEQSYHDFLSFTSSWKKIKLASVEDSQEIETELNKFIDAQADEQSTIEITHPSGYEEILSAFFPMQLKIEWQSPPDIGPYLIFLWRSSSNNAEVSSPTPGKFYWVDIENPGIYAVQVISSDGRFKSEKKMFSVKRSLRQDKDTENIAVNESIPLIYPKENSQFFVSKKSSINFYWDLPDNFETNGFDKIELELLIRNKWRQIEEIHSVTQTKSKLLDLEIGEYYWQIRLIKYFRSLGVVNKDIRYSEMRKLTILNKDLSDLGSHLKDLIQGNKSGITILINE